MAQNYWETWWAIAGPRLPRKVVRFAQWNIVIAPLTDEEFTQMKAYRAPSPSLGASTNTTVIHYPPRDEVQSRFKMIVEVEASSADEAEAKAGETTNKILAGLNLYGPGRNYNAELRKLREKDSATEYSGYSQIVTISPLEEPEDLSDMALEYINNIMHKLQSDSAANNAYKNLSIAWKIGQISGSSPLQKAILQHYVLCIEAVVNSVSGVVKMSQSDKIRAAEQEFSKTFCDQLPKRADKAKAIREASTRLREISLANTLPAIERAATTLNIDPEIMDKAKELYRFRSRTLSHPGGSDDTEIKKWVGPLDSRGSPCLADQVARSFLFSYCNRK
jgi:hypothetical protein